MRNPDQVVDCCRLLASVAARDPDWDEPEQYLPGGPPAFEAAVAALGEWQIMGSD